MKALKILWVDDEIDSLEAHIQFLQSKNYIITKSYSGIEAIEIMKKDTFDAILIDENMPGISGLETLETIKATHPYIPVIMITKDDQEELSESAIASKISDFLIKPINPKQILVCLKKHLDITRLVSDKVHTDYMQEFNKLSQELNYLKSPKDWINYYSKLIYWEMELEQTQDDALYNIFVTQKEESNLAFFKYIKKEYASWFENTEDDLLLSHNVFDKVISPKLSTSQDTLLILVDNLRYDHWKVLEKSISQYYTKIEETLYFSMLPTTTQYSRNAFFSGLLPNEIKKQYPQYWKEESDEEGKNLFEEELLKKYFNRNQMKYTFEFHKMTTNYNAKDVMKKLNQSEKDLFVLVYNYIDVISHSKTKLGVIKELTETDKSYRHLILNWFENSPLKDIIKIAHEQNKKLIITTDHGSINTSKSNKIIGTKEINHNLRYKTGKNITYDPNSLFEVKNPQEIGLPGQDSFIFAKPLEYFIFRNNYHQMANFFKNTYQHGGVSMEEMIIPMIYLSPKN